MSSKFHQKFNEDLELIYAKYTNPFEGAPELTLSTCDLPENLHILENNSYSNCGKWKVLEADSTGAYEVYHSPDKEDTSIEDNSDTSDDEYQSCCYNSDDQNHSDCNEIFNIGKSFGEKHSMSHAETRNTSSKNLKHESKILPSNYKICNLPTKQLTFANNEKNSEIELSRQDSSDECFKPERTVTISKDLWTQVQQCLHLMTSVFSQLNNNHSDERHSQRQPCLIRRSSVKQNLLNGDNTPQGLVVEKVFVRNKALDGSGVEVASRQSFLHDNKNKISEIESLDTLVGQKNSSDVDNSIQDTSQPESNRASLERKHRRRYRLVRRCSATGKTPGKPSSKIAMSEHKFGTQENRHIGESDHSFDTCLSDTDDFHVPKTVKKTHVKDIGQSERLGSPELDDVVLLEAPSLPVVGKVEYRNSKSLSTMSFQENETLFESSQERCSFSTLHSGINIERSEKRAKRPLFPQRSNKSAETMPSPIRSTLNTNLTEVSPNYTVISDANDITLSSSQNVVCRDSLPYSIKSKSPCAFLRHEILVNSLTSEHVPKITSTFACNEDKAEHKLEPGRNYDTKKRIPDLLKHHVQEANLSHKRFNERSQRGNLIPTSNSVSAKNPKVISEPDYIESKSKIVLSDTNRLLVKSSEGSPTTQHLTTQCKRKSKFLTSEKMKGQHNHSNRLNSPSSSCRHSITPRRTKFHPYATYNKSRKPPVVSPDKSLTNKSPSLISPFRKFNVKSPSSPRPKWTTLDRSPTALRVKQTRRMSDPIVVSRRNLEFGDISSGNEKIKALEKIGFDKMKGESKPNFSRNKFRTHRNNEIDRLVEDDHMRSNCSTGKCTKTFCFNCSLDFS